MQAEFFEMLDRRRIIIVVTPTEDDQPRILGQLHLRSVPQDVLSVNVYAL